MYDSDFTFYLENERKMAPNTVEAYKRDVKHFYEFVGTRGIDDIEQASNGEVVAYLMVLRQAGRSKSTINRKLASIRTFFAFLQSRGNISANPADHIKSPKIERKKIDFLTVEQIERLMAITDTGQKGTRDRAILELLYATGIRASELIEMTVDDINMKMGFVTCSGESARARIIPVGKLCRQALEAYLENYRLKILAQHENERTLFVNYMGKPITRQGLWKILRHYGEAAELPVSLTPQTLRNSFAVHMLQNGADLKSLQELMGHDDISATQIYLSVTKSRIKDVYDKAHPRA